MVQTCVAEICMQIPWPIVEELVEATVLSVADDQVVQAMEFVFRYVLADDTVQPAWHCRAGSNELAFETLVALRVHLADGCFHSALRGGCCV